jgi:transketolase
LTREIYVQPHVKAIPLETTLTMRQAYGSALAAIAQENDSVVIVDADILSPPRAWFQANAPSRIFETGVAEANSIVLAAGLAAEGKIPFWFNMGFLLTRAYSQIRQSIAEDRRNVKIVCYGCGVSGIAGTSHNYVEDLAIMRVLPNFVVVAPADTVEMTKATRAITDYRGPVYVRMPREPPLPIVFEEDYPFELGKAFTAREGEDATIIACGSMVGESLMAASLLQTEGVHAGVLNVSTVKPLDEEAVVRAARSSGVVVTAEEHSVIGGLGDAVAAALSELYPLPVTRIGIDDRFCDSGQWDLKEHYGLKSRELAETVRKSFKRNRK